MTYVESLARNWSDDKPVLVIYGMFGNDVCNRYTHFSFAVTMCLDCGFINPVTITNKWIIHHFHLHMMWANYPGTVQCVTLEGYLVHYVVKLSSLYIRITGKEWNFMFLCLYHWFLFILWQRKNNVWCVKIQSSAIVVKRVIFGMFVGGGDQGTIGGSLRDGTFLQLNYHLVIEISVNHEALQITSNIKQEVLSRTFKAFFTIA